VTLALMILMYLTLDPKPEDVRACFPSQHEVRPVEHGWYDDEGNLVPFMETGRTYMEVA
jgi:hypothetical protein